MVQQTKHRMHNHHVTIRLRSSRRWSVCSWAYPAVRKTTLALEADTFLPVSAPQSTPNLIVYISWGSHLRKLLGLLLSCQSIFFGSHEDLWFLPFARFYRENGPQFCFLNASEVSIFLVMSL